MKKAALLIFAFFSFCCAFAQNTPSLTTDFCVTFEHLNELLKNSNPELYHRQHALDSMYSRDIAAHAQSSASRSAALYVLPVVVHIIHNNGTENITDAVAMQGIRDLNDAFANVGYYDSTSGVDTRIQFCLARRDPLGNITNGITRNTSALTDLNMDVNDVALKNLNRWDPNCYVNIWLVKEICESSGGCGVAGYAYFPSSAGSVRDGIVAEARYFGSSRAASGVHIHEMGHYLGLYHTFQGGCTNANCLSDGDKVCDTPPDASTARVSCSAAPNSCNTDAQSGFTSDQPDLFQDYMDYGDFACYSVFTQGQADRMKWTLDNVRGSLQRCRSCLSPCTSPATARFTSSSHAVATGVAVSFSNLSTNATSYAWSANGVNFSTSSSSTYIFPAPGVYIVKLTATNADPNCYAEYLDTITVTCSAHAAFTYPGYPAAVGPNVAIAFTSQSTGATSYRWTVNGTQFATTANASYTFPANGTYWVKLTASNTYCSSVDSFRMFVCNPCIEICDNGADDDGNNLFDCIDPACSCSACSPKQAGLWYFGYNAAVNFNTEPPSLIPNTTIIRDDATAVATDANGHLLFYTDGTTVWDRNDHVMTNGTRLTGQNSSGSCLIVPHPGNRALYYIFTTGTTDYPSTIGLWYTIVDMRLSFGMGDVDVNNKNVNLLTANQATEKVAAVKHCNNSSVWVATHQSNNNVYNAYLIDSTGFHSTPVTSAVGTGFGAGVGNIIGLMKFSPDGRRVATPLYQAKKIDVLDFNNSTGVFSRPLTIDGSARSLGFYGVEFSANSKLLYASTTYNTSYLMQYDVTQSTAAAISASQYQVDSMLAPYMYSCIQHAPDGKMYIAIGSSSSAVHSSYLASVAHSNVRGAGCTINRQGLNLSTGLSNFGLPSFIQNYFVSGVEIDGPDSICGAAQNQTYTLLSERSCEALTDWRIVSGNATITSQNDNAATIHFNSIGVVRLAVNVANTCNGGTDTITINNVRAANLNLGNDTSECYAGVTVLNARSGFRSYEWQDGSTDSMYTAYGAGRYWVRIQDYCGNVATDTITVTVDSTSRISLGNDTIICRGRSVVLSAVNIPGGSYLWSPTTGLSNNGIPAVTVSPLQTTVYSVAVKNKQGCTTLASRKVTVTECTGLEGIAGVIGFDVLPNPAHDRIQVLMTDPEKVDAITIYNGLGQLIQLKDGRLESATTMDVSAYARGIYFVTLKCADGSIITKRFVKE